MSSGMTEKGLKRLGCVILHTEEPWMPGADGYLENGTPYFTNKARARNWAAAQEVVGRRVRVDPDGGPATAEDIERELRQKHDRERVVRARWRKRKLQRVLGTRISTTRKRP